LIATVNQLRFCVEFLLHKTVFYKSVWLIDQLEPKSTILIPCVLSGF